MPDLVRVFALRWKSILLISLLAGLAAAAVALISPKKYLGTATAIPSNSVTADRARLFNNSIQELYSEFGSPDELDRMEGTAKLDTLYRAVINKLGLVAHYGLENEHDKVGAAVDELRENSKIMRSAYGELTIKVWDKDATVSANVANALMDQIQDIQQNLQTQNNVEALAVVTKVYDSLKAMPLEDSAMRGSSTLRMARLAEYEKLVSEYQLSIATRPKTLLIEEYARPAFYADKPNVLLTVIIGLLAGFLCGFLIAVYKQARN